MNIKEFCSKYQVKSRRDDCDEEIIQGCLGHIFDYGSGKFGIVLEDSSCGLSKARLLLPRRRSAVRLGFVLAQSGDAESVLLFDPSDRKQGLAACRLVAAKRKRTVRSHPASLANLIGFPTQMPPQTVEHVEMAPLGP